MAEAVKLAASDINKTGGVNGGKLIIFVADDEATPAGAKKAAGALLAKGVNIVVGHYNSTPTMTASELYAERNVLALAPVAVIGKLTDRKLWNVVRLAPRQDEQGATAAAWLAKNFPRGKIAIVHDGSAYGRMLANSAQSGLQKAAIEPAIFAEIPPGLRQTAAIAARLAKRIASEAVDAVYWTGGSGDARQLLLALRGAKSNATFFGTEVLASEDFARLDDPAIVSGVRMTVAADPASSPEAKALLQRLAAQAAPDGAPVAFDGTAVAAYAALQLAAEAARTISSNDPRRIAEAIRSGRMFATAAGEMSFDGRGDRKENLFRVFRWSLGEDGKPVFAPQPGAR